MIYIPWFTPSFKAGGPIRSIENLISNYKFDVEYYIICDYKDVDGTKVNNVLLNQWVEFYGDTKVWYSSSRLSFRILKPLVDNLKPTHIFIVGLFSLRYNLFPIIFLSKHKLILSVRGMLHPQALAQKSLKKKIFLSFLKMLGKFNSIILHATDEKEKQHIQSALGGNLKIKIASNYPSKYSSISLPFKEVGKIKLLTTALISPMKNHHLVLQSLFFIKGEVIYDIVGAIKDDNYWQSCLSLINKLPSNITVNYHGEQKPEKIRSFIENTHLFIMPSQSENYSHSIIEALLSGRPVITSFNTPWGELEQYNAGYNVDLNVDEISHKINILVGLQNEYFKKKSAAAVNYAMNKINHNLIHDQYDRLFE